MGWWGIANSAIPQRAYKFLLAFHSPYLATFLRYSEILVENRRFEHTLSLFGAPFGVTPSEFRRYLSHQKTRVPGRCCVWRCLRDTAFSHFATVPAYDRQTDGQTTTAYTALAQRRAVKIRRAPLSRKMMSQW